MRNNSRRSLYYPCISPHKIIGAFNSSKTGYPMKIALDACMIDMTFCSDISIDD